MFDILDKLPAVSANMLTAGPSMMGKTRLCREIAEREALWRLNMDPARQDPMPNGFVSLFDPEGKPHGVRFIGSLRLAHDPVAAIGALAWALRSADGGIACELPMGRLSPASIHLLRGLVSMLRPSRLIAIGAESAADILQPPAGCQVENMLPLEGAAARPEVAVLAWRKAAWRGIFHGIASQVVPLGSITIAGTRLGSGEAVADAELPGLHTLHAERLKDVLYVVTREHPSPEAIHEACDAVGCRTAVVVDPQGFRGLLCCLENKLGDHFAPARLVELDFEGGAVHVATPAEPPLPVARLRLGRLILDDECAEAGYLRPWQV